MKRAFILIIVIGMLFSLVTISKDGVTPPAGLFLLVLGPYLLLLITAEKSLPVAAYKVKLVLASIFLLLTISTHSLILFSGPDRSGVGISALPAAIALLLQYVTSIIYAIVYYVQRRKRRKLGEEASK